MTTAKFAHFVASQNIQGSSQLPVKAELENATMKM